MNPRNKMRICRAAAVIALVVASEISAGAAVFQSSSGSTPKWLTITYTAIATAVAVAAAFWGLFKFLFNAALVKPETLQTLKNHCRFFCDTEEDIRTISTRGQFLTVNDEDIRKIRDRGQFLTLKEEDVRTIRDRGQFLTRDELAANPWIITTAWKDKQIFLTRDEVFSRKLCADLLERLLFELAADPSSIAKLRNALEDPGAVSRISESSPQDQAKIMTELRQLIRTLTDQGPKGVGAAGAGG
jgi:hypothetical protein